MPRNGSDTTLDRDLTAERTAWAGLRQRCNNPRTSQWRDYGGRGIKVCFASFDEFFAEVGKRPPGLTIDRIDNNGHYEPGNVRWATRAEQQRDRRNSVFVEIDGEQHRVLDLHKKSGVARNTIIERARQGLSLKEVISPKRRFNFSGLALGGQASGAKKREQTHCRHGHEFTPENTYITPEGWRNCRACQNAKMRRLNAAKRNRK